MKKIYSLVTLSAIQMSVIQAAAIHAAVFISSAFVAVSSAPLDLYAQATATAITIRGAQGQSSNGIQTFAFNQPTTAGDRFEARIPVDRSPLIVQTSGARFVDRWSFDPATSEVVVPVTFEGLSDAKFFQGSSAENLFTITVIWTGTPAVAASFSGADMSTLSSLWKLEVPEKAGKGAQAGYTVFGDPGTKGRLAFSFPIAGLNELGIRAPFALFQDGIQISSTLPLNGDRIGVESTIDFIDPSVPVPTEGAVLIPVARKFTIGTRQAFSLGARRTSVKAGESLEFFGFLGSFTPGRRVILESSKRNRKTGRTTYTTVGSTTVDASGGFVINATISRAVTLRARSGKLTSPDVKILISR